jgi:hypothetical protein
MEMDDEKAGQILTELRVQGKGWFDGPSRDRPHWTADPDDPTKLRVYLDGDFTVEELFALAHFHPSNKGESNGQEVQG